MFTPITLNTWPRREIFYYFSQMAPMGYSLTVSLDVTELYRTVKHAGMKFFPAYLWLVTKNLNEQVEFKCAVQDGQLGYFDVLTPLYATIHPDDHTLSLMWTEYCDAFPEFHERYVENQKRFGGHHGILAQPQTPPPNAYTVSCLPWVEFEHFAVHSYENKPYYFPSIEAGKIQMREGRRSMPLSMTCHHATTDGYHIHRFLEGLQKDMDTFEQYLR